LASQDKKNVVIIGAGIVGVSTAIWLQRAGHSVTLIDKAGPAEGTSYGNGGVLASCAIVPVTGPGLLKKAPGMLLDRDQPLFMKWRYLPKLLPWLMKYLSHNNEADTRRIAAALYPIIGDSLEDHLALAKGTGGEKYITPSDYVYVYRDRSDFEKETLSWDIRRQHGFEWREIDQGELASITPGISPEFKFGVALPNHGMITDPGAYVKALAKHVVENGGQLILGMVKDIVLENGKAVGVIADGKTIPCDEVILATGVWSGPLMERLGVHVPLESERGYHMEFYNPSIKPSAPLMISSGKFVITPMEGRIRAAGVLEFGGLDLPASQAAFDLLKRAVKIALPDLKYDRVETWMGHRPAPSDSIPIIGALPDVPNVFAGFGHHHVGLTGGPKTGRLLSQLVSGKTPNMDMSVYAPNKH
jgi:D-amino-acid dehydrogenase